MKKLVAINTDKAGLGNRMQFTLSAREIAAVEKRHFSYFWPTNSLFQPHLTELWEVSGKIEDFIPHGEVRDRRSVDLASIRSENEWLIRGFTEMKIQDRKTRPWVDLIQELEPVSEIQAEIEDWQAQLPEEYIGIQIRTNEKTHAKTLENSPVSWYEKRINEILYENKDATFFLSCDTPEVQILLESRFPSLIGLKEKGSYNSTRGVRAAIVDLYLLAGSQRILSAYWSSFPEMAHALSGFKIPMENSVRIIPARK